MRRGMHIGHWSESQGERGHYEDRGVVRWITLKWILDRMRCVDWIDLEGSCEHGNETSASIKYWEIFD
jgi:hypothetical protein